jgi:hypothetical protein
LIREGAAGAPDRRTFIERIYRDGEQSRAESREDCGRDPTIEIVELCTWHAISSATPNRRRFDPSHHVGIMPKRLVANSRSVAAGAGDPRRNASAAHKAAGFFQSPWYDDAGIVFFIIRSVSPVFGIGVSSITNTASLPPTKDTGLDEKTSSLTAPHPYQRGNGALNPEMMSPGVPT